MVSLFPHSASFRFHLTVDTLAFGCILPTTGRIRDFHPLETCAARRTKKHPDTVCKVSGLLLPQLLNSQTLRFLLVIKSLLTQLSGYYLLIVVISFAFCAMIHPGGQEKAFSHLAA